MRYTDPPYSCDYLNFFIEKRKEPIINQKSKQYVVAFHPRNGFFAEPPLSMEDLKGMAEFILRYLDDNI